MCLLERFWTICFLCYPALGPVLRNGIRWSGHDSLDNMHKLNRARVLALASRDSLNSARHVRGVPLGKDPCFQGRRDAAASSPHLESLRVKYVLPSPDMPVTAGSEACYFGFQVF